MSGELGEAVDEHKGDEDADLLVRAKILGDEKRGLSVKDIAQMLCLQESSVKIYLRDDRRRVDLYRRLFVLDDAIRERAIRILESQRAS